MLHILWILMKFILILTGILLGLALLLVLLVLFCPGKILRRGSEKSRKYPGRGGTCPDKLAVRRDKRKIPDASG